MPLFWRKRTSVWAPPLRDGAGRVNRSKSLRAPARAKGQGPGFHLSLMLFAQPCAILTPRVRTWGGDPSELEPLEGSVGRECFVPTGHHANSRL